MDRILQMIIRVVILQVTRHGINGIIGMFAGRGRGRNQNDFDDDQDQRLSEQDQIPDQSRSVNRQKTRFIRRRF